MQHLFQEFMNEFQNDMDWTVVNNTSVNFMTEFAQFFNQEFVDVYDPESFDLTQFF